MSIEGLKDQARRHEQNEQWKQALDLYRRAIERLAEAEQPDIGLYNRVGDLCVRTGDLNQAVEHYEKAVELYVEAELPNNAIAVCKKIIRNMPSRSSVYLKMGQIRGAQGFLTDARQNFLTYAERVQKLGNIDEALRALKEFADLSPGDVEIRLSLSKQLQQHDRRDEAVDLLRSTYEELSAKGDAQAKAVEDRLRELDPSLDLSTPAVLTTAPAVEAAPKSSGDGDSIGGEFGEIVIGGGGEEKEEEEEEEEEEAVASASEPGEFSISFGLGAEDEGEEEEEGAPLPLPGFGEPAPSFALGEEAPSLLAEPAAEPEAPGFVLGGDDAEQEAEQEEEYAEPLPLLDTGEDEFAAPLPLMGFEEEPPRLLDTGDEAEPLPLIGEPAEPLAASASAGEERESLLTAEAFGESDRGDRGREEYVGAGEEMHELDAGLSEFNLGRGTGPGQARERAFEEAAAEVRTPSGPEQLIAAGQLEAAEQLIRELMEREPGEVSHRQRLVEVAFRRGDPAAQADAYIELARCLERTGGGAQARAVYQQVLQLDPDNSAAQAALTVVEAPPKPKVPPVSSSEDYVDLGSLIFGEEEEKTTRFQVAYDQPTGDEQADFAKMLGQFKAKIAENIGTDDVRAHHDLGTAYREMGLVDEAIEEFQAALRASRNHLPTYELLGQCFLDKKQPEAAVKTLTRALNVPFEIEDELLGIYYYLGRAYESLGNKPSAVEFYDRVFSLDINFMDVTERLRALR